MIQGQRPFSGTEVLGVTAEQIGTPTGIPEFGTNFTQETHPTTFAELLQLSGLSHGTDVWLGRLRLNCGHCRSIDR